MTIALDNNNNNTNIASLNLNNETYVTLEPLKLEFKHGPNNDTYRITFIKQRMGENGEEKNLDLSKLTLEEIQVFIKQVKNVIDLMDGFTGRPNGLMTSHSITLNFTQKHESGPSFIENTLGKIFKNTLGWKEQNMILEKITYKETATSEEKTFAVKLETYDAESQGKILKATLPLKRSIRYIANKEQENLKPNTLKNKPFKTENLMHLAMKEEEDDDKEESLVRNVKPPASDQS